MPLPVPVFSVTVYTVLLPETPVTAGVPPSPDDVRTKSEASTPVTFSPNVTVQLTLEPALGLVAARAIDTTAGGQSTTTAFDMLYVVLAAPVHVLFAYTMKYAL